MRCYTHIYIYIQEQVAFFGVAFARYVATSARSAVDKAIGMVFDDGSVVVVHAASSSRYSLHRAFLEP